MKYSLPNKMLSLALVTLMLNAAPSVACSAFCLTGPGQVVVGKSYDWYFGHGHGAIYTNPRGTARTTLIFDQSPNPASWVSKYGSVTFTQFGRGVPISGMNERGLVVELLQLESAEYNSAQIEKPYVNESQWAQYQLDRYATVAEVIAHVEDLRIERAYTGIHYFIADAQGHSATVDFVDGKVVVHANETLPVPALTNDSYDQLINDSNARPLDVHDGRLDPRSEDRFHRARRLIEGVASVPNADLTTTAWQILNAVRLKGFAADALMEPSQWNLVHYPDQGAIAFKTRAATGLKWIDLKARDLGEGAPELMLDMNLDVVGDVGRHLRPYSFEQNKALIEKNNWLFRLAGKSDRVQPAVEYGRVCGARLGGATAD